MLVLDNITKSYSKNPNPAVKSLSLKIKPGEIFGFIGPNGAGKTTTLKMISGILQPDSGSIEIFGVDIAKNPIEAKKLIGYVSDNNEFYDRLTGIELLNFLSDIYGVTTFDRNARLTHFLSMFEMEDKVSSPIKSMSHGMKQKLGIIGALLHNPPLWLLDEPLTGLDPQSAYRLKSAMREHCAQGNIVFFSTHVLDVAEKLCDHVGIISKGNLVACGTLDELKSNYGAFESLESLFMSIIGENDGE